MNLVEIYEMQSNVLFISCQAAASSTALCFSWLPGGVQPRGPSLQACVDILCASQTETQLPPRWVQSQEPPEVFFFKTASIIWCYLSLTDMLWLIFHWQWCFTPQLAAVDPHFSCFGLDVGCDHSSTDTHPEQSELSFERIFSFTGLII